MEIEDTAYYRYAVATEADEGAGRLIRLACRRFLSDLRRADLEFRPRRVERCLLFLRGLKHYKGEHAGHHFEPEPWQEFIVANLLGFYWRSSGLRRYTRAYVEVSRKNGKSYLINALAMYFLLADGEASPEVIVGANSREQAKSVDFEMCQQFARQLDPRGRSLTLYRDEIKVPDTVGRLKVISADNKTNDGYNPSVGIIDEYHSAPTSAMRDVIVSGMGTRRQPMLFVITTAGFNKGYPCYKLRTACAEMLHGHHDDDTTFAAIYSLDEGDDWQDPAVWRKANPNLGVTVLTKYLAEQVHSAANNPDEEVNVRTKNLNQWCDAAAVWIPDSYLLESSRKVDRSAYADQSCYVGVDLAAVGDLTAVSYMFPRPDGRLHFFTDYYLPESALQDKFNKALYSEWSRRGYLRLTPGNVTDYDYIAADIIRNAETYDIRAVGYDRWNATQWAVLMTEQGMPMQEYGQNMTNFNGPTREFERRMLGGEVVMEESPVTLYCFRNVAIKEDWNENRKPVKAVIQNKIDGTIAMLQALGVYLSEDHYGSMI